MAEALGFSQRAEQDRKKIDATTLILGNKNEILPCEQNAWLLIEGAPKYLGLHYDDFLSRMRIEGRDWVDADDLDCLRCCKRCCQ